MSKAAAAKIKPQSELAADIDRLAAVNAERKALEKEEELLKARFRERAGGVDTTFSHNGFEVVVAREVSMRIDNEKVAAALGGADKLEALKSPSESWKVTVRPETEKKAAAPKKAKGKAS